MLDRLESILRRIIGRPENRNLPLWTLHPESSAFAVPNAIEWLVRANQNEREKLASILADLMRTIGSRDWTRLYTNFRSPWIKPSDIPKLQQLPDDDAVEMLGVATLSTNGFTREAAIKALGTLGHPRALPYLLLRLGDWVGPVRDSALIEIQKLMQTDIDTDLIEHHHLIDHLVVIQRVDLSSIRSAIEDRLKEPGSRNAVEAGLNHKNASTRRFCYRILLEKLGSSPSLIQKALLDPDPAVRRWLAVRVAKDRSGISDETYRCLLLDRASSVSTVILRSMSTKQISEFVPDLIDLSLADARPVRESARWALKSQGWTSFAEEARGRIQATDTLDVSPGWISTLGETGDVKLDYEVAARFIDHSRSRVRAAAVLSISQLDQDRSAPVVVERLNDSSGIVRRAAINALSETPRHQWYNGSKQIVFGGTNSGQVAALQLINLQTGWDTIPVLLYAVQSSNSDLVGRAWQALYDWQRIHGTRGWIKPSRKCQEEIVLIWPSIRKISPPCSMHIMWLELKRDIEAHLDEEDAHATH